MLAKILGAGALLLIGFVMAGLATEYAGCQDIMKKIPIAQAAVDRNSAIPPEPIVRGAIRIRVSDIAESDLLQLNDRKNGNMFCKNK